MFACDVVQQGIAYGVVGFNTIFGIILPTTQGFVAYGTTSYGYADFDNLRIEDNPDIVMKYFDSSYITFSNRL